ncbi:MAG: VWA domain-containing protein [Verrucomicrobiota bacterium]
MNWENWRFIDPWFFALVLIPALAWLLRQFRGGEAVIFPFAAQWNRPVLVRRSGWPLVLMTVGLILFVFAIARPQKVEDKQQQVIEGYDIVLVIDLSESMLKQDYSVGGRSASRLEAIKPVIEAFINRRKNDRIGIVVFGDHAYTLAPLTFDHKWLRRQTGRLFAGVAGKNTAIGDGLGVALGRLDQAERVEKGRRLGAFVVLLTDGQNNRGALQPLESAELAASRGIPVYTIGAGSEQRALFGFGPKLGGGLDEETLKQIADATGGRYFRAADSGTVARAFSEIDRTQKIEFEATSYLLTEEWFPPFATLGFVFVGVAGMGLWFQRGGEVIQ